MATPAQPYTTQEQAAGYYAAFVTSMELRQASETLVWQVGQGNWRQHDVLLEVIARFDDEAARAYVLEALGAMNIHGNAERFVQSTLHTLTSTISRLARQIVPKLDEQQMRLAAGHVRSLSLALPTADGTRCPMTGFLVPDYLEEMRADISRHIRAGDWQRQRQRVSKLLAEMGDLMLDEIYLKSIRLMGFGYLTEKIIQGGAGVVRTVQHQLIHWAINSLEEKEFMQMADYTEKLMLHLPEPLPHRFIFYPNAQDLT